MPGDQQQYKKWMSEGHSAAWDQEWQKAAECYQMALEEFPESLQASLNYANACFELGKFDEALQHYGRILQKTPGDILVLEKVGQIFEIQGKHRAGSEIALRTAELHLKNGDLRKAVENWQRTLRLDPSNLRARTRLAMHFEKHSQYPQAISQYLVIASLLQHQGNKTRAIELVQHALKLVPNHQEAREALALIQANQLLPLPNAEPAPLRTRKLPDTDPPVAKREVDQRASDDPLTASEKKALEDLASLIFDQDDGGEMQEARSIQSITMGTGPLNRVQVDQQQILLHVGQAVDLQARGQYSQAVEELERAIDIGLDHSAAHYNLGLLYQKEDKLEQALRNLQIAVKHPDYALSARLLMGRLLAQKGRLQESAMQYLEALRLADGMAVPPDRADALFQVYEPLMESHAQVTDPEVHKRLIHGIDDLLAQPDWLERVRAMRAQIPVRDDSLPPTPLVELITELEGSQVVEMLSNIHDLAQRGYYRIAMEEAFNAVMYAPTYLPLHTFMGEILLKQDRVPEAITKFNTVARAYSSRGEAPRSIELLRRIIRLSPLDLKARQSLIEQLSASGKIEDTIQEYLDLGEVHYRLAELDAARAAYQKALNLSQQAQISNEWTIEILHHLADIDLQRLDWQQAAKIYEQIARIDPGDRKAAIDLVDLHFRMNNEAAALAALGNHVAFLNRAGRQHEALETLEELVKNMPDQMPIRRTLAEQYQLAGNTARAVEIWEEIYELLMGEQDLVGARQALEALLQINPSNADEYRRKLDAL